MLLLTLALTLIIPSLIWGYVFSYQEEWHISKEKFFLWIVSWGFSVIAVLLINKLLLSQNLILINPFISLHGENIPGLGSSTSLYLSTFGVAIVSILLSILLFKRKVVNNYKSIVWFNTNLAISLLIIFFSIVFISVFFIFFPHLNVEITSWVKFNSLIYWSIKLVIFYYVIVAIIEEVSKYLSFLWSMYSSKENKKRLITYTIVVAIWFAVIENIIYTHNIYKSAWFSSDLVSTIFLRSVFSISSHILFSTVISYFYMKSEKWLEICINTVKWILIAIWLHVLYDVWLSTNSLVWIPFIYLIWTYLFITHIYYSIPKKELSV